MSKHLIRLQVAAIKGLERVSPRLAAKRVFSMFVKANRSPMLVSEKNQMGKATRAYLSYNGDKVTHYAWGSGDKTVLLIHGWESRTSRFHQIVRQLVKAGYRVVAFDSPGHGESEGTTVTILQNFEIISSLQAEYGTFEAVISHSLGSLNAFYAVRNGVEAKKIVGISSVCEFSYLTHRFASYFKLRDATIACVNENLENLFDDTTIWERFSADYQPQKIGCPVALIHDRHDKFVESSQSAMIRDAFGDEADLHLTDKLGHYRILSDPAAIRLVVDKVASSKLKNDLLGSVLMPEIV